MKLLSTGNPKIMKGEKMGYNSYILHLAPASLSGYNTCPKATEGCKSACLNTAGRGGMFKKGETTNMIQQARIRKTKMFYENRQEFMVNLVKDIQLAIKQSEKKGLIPVIRLNGTSDIAWEKYRFDISYKGYTVRDTNIFELFPNIQFYDYTKMLNRKVNNIKNYHLTFSAADGNDNDVIKAFEQGYNVAMVFGIAKKYEMIKEYMGKPVYNGDDSDLRFLDPDNHIVGLYAKGKAKKDNTGFVKFIDIKAV
jgi:hypothetical protein